MPFPRWLRSFNRSVFNPLAGPAAARLPGLAVLLHRGRRSGHTHRTPLNVFPVNGHFVIALTYGPEVDWLANLTAAGEGVLLHRGGRIPVGRPRRIGPGEAEEALPGPVRLLLRALRVREFVRVTRLPDEAGGSGSIDPGVPRTGGSA